MICDLCWRVAPTLLSKATEQHIALVLSLVSSDRDHEAHQYRSVTNGHLGLMHTGVLGDEYMYTDLHVLGQSFWGELSHYRSN